jgi:hypothetical protein
MDSSREIFDSGRLPKSSNADTLVPASSHEDHADIVHNLER